jgi:hypothetical protein
MTSRNRKALSSWSEVSRVAHELGFKREELEQAVSRRGHDLNRMAQKLGIPARDLRATFVSFLFERNTHLMALFDLRHSSQSTTGYYAQFARLSESDHSLGHSSGFRMALGICGCRDEGCVQESPELRCMLCENFLVDASHRKAWEVLAKQYQKHIAAAAIANSDSEKAARRMVKEASKLIRKLRGKS